MASTHQQLLYHVVFSTKNRQRFLSDEALRREVFAYLAGVARNLGGYAVTVGGWIDHVHLLVRIPAKIAVSEFVGKLKANSSKHVNDSGSLSAGFAWQRGFGVFSVSASKKDAVVRYIRGQAQHHAGTSFADEYLDMLERHEIEYDAEYVLD